MLAFKENNDGRMPSIKAKDEKERSLAYWVNNTRYKPGQWNKLTQCQQEQLLELGIQGTLTEHERSAAAQEVRSNLVYGLLLTPTTDVKSYCCN